MPPILGLSETIRLALAADSMALIIRWGRTERQLVQYALDALRTAGAFASAAILNDVNLKAQQRRGYHDRTIVYSDEDLYRAGPKYREPDGQAPLPAVAKASGAISAAAATRAQRPDARPNRTEAVHNPSTTARPDIQRLYERHLGK